MIAIIFSDLGIDVCVYGKYCPTIQLVCLISYSVTLGSMFPYMVNFVPRCSWYDCCYIQWPWDRCLHIW